MGLMDPTQMPPMAPMAALIANANTTMRVVEMPERLAESGSLAVAVICLPTLVRLDSAHSPMKSSAATAMTQMFCTSMVSFQRCRVRLPGKL